MSPTNFLYWLRGYLELLQADRQESQNNCILLTEKQIDMINEHIAIAMKHSELESGELLKPYTPPNVIPNFPYIPWGQSYPTILPTTVC
jgi:hypothetical protein